MNKKVYGRVLWSYVSLNAIDVFKCHWLECYWLPSAFQASSASNIKYGLLVLPEPSVYPLIQLRTYMLIYTLFNLTELPYSISLLNFDVPGEL